MNLKQLNLAISKRLIYFIIVTLLSSSLLKSEEGMWPFFSLPLQQLKEKYNFEPDKAWIDHVRLSSVQIGGGSGAFISPDGLIMTNHHVVVGSASQIKNLNFVENGYYATDNDKEIKLPGLSAFILVQMKNITAEIQGSFDESMPQDTIDNKIQWKKNDIVTAANKENKLYNRIIKLNNNEEYWLYSYKTLSDIRLVFAPEASVAAFGGYFFDNFTYPRYNLDASFVRAYENDKPYKPEHYFKWKTSGAVEDELVFIPGNPGNTKRFITLPEYDFMKDFKERISYLLSRIVYEHLQENNYEGFDNNTILHITNMHKINSGLKYGLDLQHNRLKLEKTHSFIIEKLSSKPDLLSEYISAYNEIENSIEIEINQMKQTVFQIDESDLYEQAKALYEITYELDTNKKLTTSQENRRNKLIKKIEDTTIINKEKQINLMTKYLSYLLEENLADKLKLMEFTGYDDPKEAVSELCGYTKLFDRDFRVKLMKGGLKSIESCNDAFVKFVVKVENAIRRCPNNHNMSNIEVINKYKKTVAKAYNEAYGNMKTPDANFTLRFSFGTVKGYYNNGYNIPWKTTLYGLFDRSASNGNKGDYFLPKRVWDAVDDINKSTPCNFVTTNDIIGGNSGSSVINRDAEVIGLVFDGNFESIIGEYVFDDIYARAVCVHPAFIIEALRKIYGAGNLADEIEGK